jgi:hypothetical protein
MGKRKTNRKRNRAKTIINEAPAGFNDSNHEGPAPNAPIHIAALEETNSNLLAVFVSPNVSHLEGPSPSALTNIALIEEHIFNPTLSASRNRNLPNEILWHIFTFYLLLTRWTGWSILLRLDKSICKGILSHTLLIRNTLPHVRGGVIPALEWLFSKKPNKDKWSMLCSINGVASGIHTFDNALCENLRNMGPLHHETDNLFYLDVINIVAANSLTFLVPNKAIRRILVELKRLWDTSKEREYNR